MRRERRLPRNSSPLPHIRRWWLLSPRQAGEFNSFLKQASTQFGHQVLTSPHNFRLDSVDVSIRRHFSEIPIPMPSEKARTAILRRLTASTNVSPELDFDE